MSLPRLPIDAVLPELLSHLTTGPNAVLAAPPGAGKTTRVPLALLDAPWRGEGRIVLLEPRRLAARGAAAHMARLIGEEVGGTVGYRVRLESKVSAKTRIEVVTEGVFTRMILDDPLLEGIAAVLLDEFHERSLDADLALALSLDVQGALRPDLRLLVMSATLDVARVASALHGAPTVVAEGRAFPVETRHRPRGANERVEDAVADAVMEALSRETGSILAFLPGTAEIERATARLAERTADPTIEIVPLHGGLDVAAQDRAIRPPDGGGRKVVFATSIAETSLTIEGVRVVIDSGFARVPRYEPETGLTRLETVRVSQAAADQRRGRAGRTEPGVCYRLWEEGQTRALPPFATPEILQADLSDLVLACARFGVTDPTRLPFLDAPPAAALIEARALLRDLSAIDDAGRITDEGRALARLLLPPRLAHMLNAAARRGEGALAAEIAAILSERGLGGADTDLRQRLRTFRTDRSNRAREARALAARWTRMVGADPERSEIARAGRVLALAYPDRVAKARPGKAGEIVLANGRGASLEPTDALAREPFLVVADIAGARARGRVRLAAPLSEADLMRDFADRIELREELAFDKGARAVRARRVRRLGGLVLAEEPIPATGEGTTAALLAGIAELGLGALPWTAATRQLVDRARFLHAAAPEDWPDLSEARLIETLADWLGPFIPGKSALAEIEPGEIAAALDALLGPARRRLEAEAPSHFQAPTGTHVPVEYHPERGPVVAIRVQELFGLDRHPTLAGGKIPLTLDLLSPAHRPVQTTRDLPGFWRGSWAEVRAEMRGRYPKHPWPENPLSAAPTSRAKPRGT